MATGVLPLLINGATRFAQYLPEHDKAYRATLKLGVTTNTLDRTGEVTQIRPVTSKRADVESAIQSFLGKIEQVPPMFSAVSVGGVRLYELARRGEEIERKSRLVTIKSITLIDADETADEYTIDVDCSAGTYIRTLAADLGEALGCGAHLIALTRTMANGFALENCITQEALESLTIQELTAGKHFVQLEDALAAYPAITVTAAQAIRFSNGGVLYRKRCDIVPDGLVRIFSPSGLFLGLAKAIEDELKAERVLAP